jgi:DNA-directed RNA polymerase specialized sigma24 family protein
VTTLPEGSVTRWLHQLQASDQTAAQELWNRYFRRLVGLARSKLQGVPRRAADEEDVALSAFDSFCRGVEQGRFPRLDDRDDLWRLLAVITERKACDLVQHERRQKRGSGDVRGESGFAEEFDFPEEGGAGIDQLPSREPSPEIAAQIADECRRLLELLGDATLRSVAVWKMEGYTNAEIADKLGCVPVTIERKLQLIRRLWVKEREP